MAAPPTLREPISDGSAWTRDELTADRSWIYEAGESLVSQTERSLEVVRTRGLRHTEISASDFQLGAEESLLRDVHAQLEHGRGIALVRGLPIEGKPLSDCELLLAGIASNLGTSVVQDTQGTHIDHVTDRGLSYENIAVRGYMTNAQLTPHCDSSDVTTLLCIRGAKAGGVNTISSSLAVYNQILADSPELLEALYRGFYYNVRGQGPPGKFRDVTSHRVPVFLYHQGRMSCRFNEKGILTSEQLPGVPSLTELERAAVAKVAELSKKPEFSIDVLLEPGDWLLMCNYTVFHNRSEFEDHAEPSRKRLLLRKWINLPGGRELTWEFGDHFETGIRQGPFVDGVLDQHTASADPTDHSAPLAR
jgi:hypothetical protein